MTKNTKSRQYTCCMFKEVIRRDRGRTSLWKTEYLSFHVLNTKTSPRFRCHCHGESPIFLGNVHLIGSLCRTSQGLILFSSMLILFMSQVHFPPLSHSVSHSLNSSLSGISGFAFTKTIFFGFFVGATNLVSGSPFSIYSSLSHLVHGPSPHSILISFTSSFTSSFYISSLRTSAASSFSHSKYSLM